MSAYTDLFKNKSPDGLEIVGYKNEGGFGIISLRYGVVSKQLGVATNSSLVTLVDDLLKTYGKPNSICISYRGDSDVGLDILLNSFSETNKDG